MDAIATSPNDPTVPIPGGLELIDVHLPAYDVALTEHLVVDADPAVVFAAARDFDFLTTDAPLVAALMTVRALPGLLRRRPATAPATPMLARDSDALPGWVLLGEVPGQELVFGAVGKFWKADIEWRDVPGEQFAGFDAPGWGKIACHLRVRPDGPGRSILSYECRTATTDPASRARMARYWWLIRPFVAYILRAVVRTIRTNVDDHHEPPVAHSDSTSPQAGGAMTGSPEEAAVDLYWLPLGAGDAGRCVRGSGRLYEALSSLLRRRERRDLYHSALIVRVDDHVFAIEMAPVWAVDDGDRGVVAEGPVGMRSWGRTRLFRYEVRCWRDGTIPDLVTAVDSPRRVSADRDQSLQVLRLVATVPTAIWGRDEHRTGEMWNSNSLTSWLLASSGHDLTSTAVQPPAHGRAPGWSAGVIVAESQRLSHQFQ